MRSGEFEIRCITANERGYSYDTFQVVGYLNGQRVRKRFKSHDEAVGEKTRLEVQAANTNGQVRAAVTRLTEDQLAVAEACFRRLGDTDMTEVLDWYFANYRPPCVDKSLTEAKDAFLAALKPDVEVVHYNDVKRRLAAFCNAFPSRNAGTVETAEIDAYLNAQRWAGKTFNNARGALHTFFDYCAADTRRWVKGNPVTAIRQKKVVRGLPQIESPEKLAELFRFLETYTGGERRPKKPGFLVPYFAFATFGGLRPSVPNGEIWKLAHSPNLSRLLNTKTGVIHVTPEIAKTDAIRQVKIRANFAEWLNQYPLSEYPLVMPNMQACVTDVRKRFGLGDDVLRHTFLSAHVAKFKSLGEAALEAGNSESIIRAHYLNVMSEDEAEAFWSIVPQP